MCNLANVPLQRQVVVLLAVAVLSSVVTRMLAVDSCPFKVHGLVDQSGIELAGSCLCGTDEYCLCKQPAP